MQLNDKYFPLAVCDFYREEAENALDEIKQFYHKSRKTLSNLEPLVATKRLFYKEKFKYEGYFNLDEYLNHCISSNFNPYDNGLSAFQEIIHKEAHLLMNQIVRENKANNVKYSDKDIERLAIVTDTRDYMCFGFILNEWSKMKQVYKIDKTFADELDKTKIEKLMISGEALTHLPYNRFWLDVSECECFSNVLGILVDIRTIDDIVHFSTYQITKNENKNEPVYYSEYNIIGLNETRDYFEGYYDYLKKNEAVVREQDIIKFNNALNCDDRVKNSILINQILLYLASDKPDIIENENTKQTSEEAVTVDKNVKPKNEPSEIKQSNVGFIFGSNFRKYKERVESEHKEGHAGSHKSKIPHYVAAHWHTYLIGKGRTERVIKWIKPYFTGTNDTDYTDLAVIHKVK